MKKEREFLNELYKRRVFKVPFIEYFQKDKYLRNLLFQTFKNYRQAFLDIKLFKSLDEISKEIDDFHKIVLNRIEYDAKESSESVFKNIINKLEIIRIPKLTKAILNDFVNESENIDLVIAEALEFNDFKFKEQYGISTNEAKRRYREIKRYADNYIHDYLKDYNKREKGLLNKFKHIGFLNYKNVVKELKEFDTTSQKLDYLKELKQNYYDKFESVKSTINEDEYHFFHNNYTTVWESIFGNYALITPISIQEPVYNKYFKNGLREPEFTYWFLKFNAETVFNWQINDKEFQSKISSNLKDTFLNAELKQLNDFELKAKNLLLNKEIDIHKPHRNNHNFRKEIALLRVLDGNYYKENTTYAISGLGSDEVQAYYKHFLLKPYLEKLLKSKSFKKNDIDEAVQIENQYLIDESFIECLRLNINSTHFIFEDKSEKIIVPDNFTHDYLLRNFNIDESIKRFYYAPTRDLITDEDFQKKVEIGYNGTIDRTLRPYPINIYGAYFGRKAMYYRLLMLIKLDKDVTLNGTTVKYLSDLAPYFKEYAQGFEKGFNNFKDECIDPFLIEFSDKNDYINKVFEYLTKHIIFEHSWFNNHAGFAINDNRETGIKKIVGAFEDGVKQGYFYKAWSIVFSNNQLFKPLFEKYYLSSELQTKNKIAHELIGDNTTRSTNIEYHHIKEILNKHSITEAEARQILLDMKGSFNKEQNRIIVEPIILYLERSREGVSEDKKTNGSSNSNQNEFSVLEWATIFYYANETNLLPKAKTIKNRMIDFQEHHKISTTFNNFKTSYYDAKKRINKKNDYPIDKLEKILPFLDNNYKETVTKVDNDISFLESENTDY